MTGVQTCALPILRLEEYGYGNGKVTPWNTIQPVDQNGVVLFKIIEYEGGVE